MSSMQTNDAYVIRIIKAAKKLIEGGMRDPSVPEIACAVYSNVLAGRMPSNPLETLPELGGEIYDGIAARMKIVRQQLEDWHDIKCALISPRYYKLGYRGNDIESIEDAYACLPAPRNSSFGL